MSGETIAAIATGSGRAGIGIVRVSGPGVADIAHAITGRALVPREATHLPFRDADDTSLDIGLAIRFVAPHSFTGEDVLELQGHGGPAVLDLVLARVLALGARPARPGEFSERAFLNDKLDLAQAEAVADLVDASGAAAARAAVRSLDGAFSADVDAVLEEVIGLRVWLEAALDFSEEDIDFLADPELDARARALVGKLDDLLARSAQGRRLRDGLTVVIAGRPNVGKSSLLNALAGADSAIVTDVAGTTRDVLREDILLDGVPLHIVDTAGLRDSDDPVEGEGIRRARQAVASADHVLVVLDATDPVMPDVALPDDLPRTVVLNKCDLIDAGAVRDIVEALGATRRSRTHPVAPSAEKGAGRSASSNDLVDAVVPLSARTGKGMDTLHARLLAAAGHDGAIEGVYLARRRHLDALEEARLAANDALARLADGTLPELAAEELRRAQQALDRITGRFDVEDLLGRIFADFCVGK